MTAHEAKTQIRLCTEQDEGCGSSHKIGELDVSYDTLVNVIGVPQSDGDGDKTDCEWDIKINGKVMHIYNWKNGINYCGLQHGLLPPAITHWMVGAEKDSPEEMGILERALGIDKNRDTKVWKNILLTSKMYWDKNYPHRDVRAKCRECMEAYHKQLVQPVRVHVPETGCFELSKNSL